MALKNSSKTSLPLLKAGVFEVGFIIAAIALFFGLLNYFNIISLSTLYPNQFGFLPHQPFKESTRTSNVPPVEKFKFSCPVEKEFCNSGKEAFDGEKFLGIGYNLPLGKKIFAVIPGAAVFGGAEDKSKEISSHSKIVIGGTGVSQGYVITYEYFGLPKIKDQTKNVSQNEELGAVWGGSFPKESPFNGINVLVKVTTNTGQDVKISEFD